MIGVIVLCIVIGCAVRGMVSGVTDKNTQTRKWCR